MSQRIGRHQRHDDHHRQHTRADNEPAEFVAALPQYIRGQHHHRGQPAQPVNMRNRHEHGPTHDQAGKCEYDLLRQRAPRKQEIRRRDPECHVEIPGEVRRPNERAARTAEIFTVLGEPPDPASTAHRLPETVQRQRRSHGCQRPHEHRDLPAVAHGVEHQKEQQQRGYGQHHVWARDGFDLGDCVAHECVRGEHQCRRADRGEDNVGLALGQQAGDPEHGRQRHGDHQRPLRPRSHGTERERRGNQHEQDEDESGDAAQPRERRLRFLPKRRGVMTSDVWHQRLRARLRRVPPVVGRSRPALRRCCGRRKWNRPAESRCPSRDAGAGRRSRTSFVPCRAPLRLCGGWRSP